MLLTLLALLGSGCTRGLNESPIEFEERSIRHTENMTPQEWESFKNKAIESIINKYIGQTSPNSSQIQVMNLSPSAAEQDFNYAEASPSAARLNPSIKDSDKLDIPETLNPITLPPVKPQLAKPTDKSFESIDRYSQLKIKPEEPKGKHYKVPPNAVNQAPSTPIMKPESSNTYAWPVKGTIASGYGKSDKGTNNGINIKAKAGSPIVAIDRGKVIFVGAIKSMGKVILVEHPNHMIAAYAQVGDITVRANDTVKKGQKIANILSIDGTDGELHFELRKGTKAVNPMDYLVN